MLVAKFWIAFLFHRVYFDKTTERTSLRSLFLSSLTFDSSSNLGDNSVMANIWASFQIFRCLALAILCLVILAACSPSSTQDGPNCQNLTIPVTISSNNAHFPADFTPNDIVLESLLSSAGNLVFDLLIEGTFNISASYCEPEVYVQSRASTLQFLVHGAVYTRNYVSCLFFKTFIEGAQFYLNSC